MKPAAPGPDPAEPTKTSSSARAAEAYCPTCERSYGSDTDRCPSDGSRLVKFKAEKDAVVGRVLEGRFEIRRRIGAGGMGAVYTALQASVGREVAVKVIDRRMSSDRSAAKRFLREARISSRLSHPNSVTVHDFGQSEDGLLYIVMEKLEGVTLSDLLKRRGKLGLDDIVEIGVQICDALEAAHALDIIHRDLKPANIMLVDGPGDRQMVKVLDFGLAKSLVGDDQTTTITESNVVLGTPSYMAPEMIRGEQVDGRGDLYSLGCMLYKMATGRTPFSAPSTSLVMARHLADAPEPIADRDLAPLGRLVDRLLAKDPARRPESARAVREALLALRAGTESTVMARAAPSQQAEIALDETARRPRARRWLLGAAALAVLLGGVAALLWPPADRVTEVEPAAAGANEAPMSRTPVRHEIEIAEPAAVMVDAAVMDGEPPDEPRPKDEPQAPAEPNAKPRPKPSNVPSKKRRDRAMDESKKNRDDVPDVEFILDP